MTMVSCLSAVVYYYKHAAEDHLNLPLLAVAINIVTYIHFPQCTSVHPPQFAALSPPDHSMNKPQNITDKTKHQAEIPQLGYLDLTL